MAPRSKVLEESPAASKPKFLAPFLLNPLLLRSFWALDLDRELDDLEPDARDDEPPFERDDPLDEPLVLEFDLEDPALLELELPDDREFPFEPALPLELELEPDPLPLTA